VRIVRHWYKIATNGSKARAGRSTTPTPVTDMSGLSDVMISLYVKMASRGREREVDRGASISMPPMIDDDERRVEKIAMSDEVEMIA